jgi:hypothetical protein
MSYNQILALMIAAEEEGDIVAAEEWQAMLDYMAENDLEYTGM